VIGLGLRLTISGGRDAITRLIVLTAAVGLGVGLLLTAISGINAVNSQNDRIAWLATGSWVRDGGPEPTGREPLWWLIRGDNFDGRTIARVDVAATGPASPVPPGIPHLPGPGQYYVSPALAALLRDTPADQLGDRYPGRPIGTIGDAALPSPDSLVIIIGHTAAQLASMPDAVRAAMIVSTPPSGCAGQLCAIGYGINAEGIDLVLVVVALALLFPVLIFIATGTRLSAARREQRFAAMRLVGATPQQVSLVAAVESTVAAVLGVAVGFGLFFALRAPVAGIPFTGLPFFPGDMSLSAPDVLAVAIGVPVAAAAAARLALHRVHISPLGVTRRVTPKPPRAWRLLPLLAGVAELGFFVVHGAPATVPEQIQAFAPGFGLIMIGLVVAGPWLTMAGARIMARRTSRPGALIAARRMADDPRGAFRAVSGLVLALLVTTVAVAVISTENAQRSAPVDGPAASTVLTDQFARGLDPQTPPAASSAVLAALRGIRGVTGTVEVRTEPGLTFPGGSAAGRKYNGEFQAGLVSCAQLASTPDLGRCPAGAAAALFPADVTDNIYSDESLAGHTWPAANVSALDSLPLDSIDVATNGSVRAVEQARTVLETAYPAQSLPNTLGEVTASAQSLNNQYQQLADVVILVSLPVAGCTLAASAAAGLADRKRPFSLLRLTGAQLGMLRRVVALESAIPLLVVAAVSIGIGFGASALYVTAEMQHPLVAPYAAYYVITAAGIAASLIVIAVTFPLLRRITGPEVARNQ
jgi:hypothetical protein